MRNIKKVLFVALIVFCLAFQTIPVFADEAKPELDVNAAYVVETNTGKVIYSMDEEEKNFPASVTKILTAIIAIERCDLNETATVSSKALSNIPSGYVTAPIFVDEQMRIEDLLYALMLKSANDAAYVLAEHIGGSTEGFADIMNEKAKEIGCKNSHFVNPNGIHNDDHYTTAYDMYLIAKYAMQNETFRKIVSTSEYTLPITNRYMQEDRIMKNTNYFLQDNSKFYNEDVNGIKTGTTTQAGNCIVTSISKDGMDLISVVLGSKTSDSKFSDTKQLLDYAYETYTLTNMHKKDDVIKNIEVEKAKKNEKNLDLVIADDITVLNKKVISKEAIRPEININSKIVAPIEKGQELGTITYNVEGIEYTSKLLAANNVEKRTYEKEIGITILILLLLIFMIRKYNLSKRKRRKRRGF